LYQAHELDISDGAPASWNNAFIQKVYEQMGQIVKLDWSKVAVPYI
jgi:hypothetical protein